MARFLSRSKPVVYAIPRSWFRSLCLEPHCTQRQSHWFTAMLTHGSPRIPGHEVIGHVVAVGPHEKQWKVGDRVGGPWHGGHDG